MVMTSSDHLVFDRDPDRKVTHGVDEDHPRPPPPQRLDQRLRVDGDPEPGPAGAGVAFGLILGLAHGLEPPGQGEGIAVLAARRNAVAAGDRVPGGLGPFDGGAVGHAAFPFLGDGLVAAAVASTGSGVAGW